MRFMIEPAGGQTAVIDIDHNKRVVALCAYVDEAIAIMAFLNGDLEQGRQMHAAFLDRLKHPH